MVYLTVHGGHCVSQENQCYALGDERRLVKLIEIAKSQKEPYLILIGCGTSSITRQFCNEDGVLFNYLIKNGIDKKLIKRNPKGYSTITEIVAMHEMLKHEFNETDTIVSVSSWYHLPRIWMIWNVLFGVSPKLKAANPYENPQVLLRETCSLIKTLFLLFFRQNMISAS